jgi:hypothetical protein
MEAMMYTVTYDVISLDGEMEQISYKAIDQHELAEIVELLECSPFAHNVQCRKVVE